MVKRDRWLFLAFEISLEYFKHLAASTQISHTGWQNSDKLEFGNIISEWPAAETQVRSATLEPSRTDSKYSSLSVKRNHFATDFMEAVLNCKPEELEDYYGLLGCDELSSVSSGCWVWGSAYLLGDISLETRVYWFRCSRREVQDANYKLQLFEQKIPELGSRGYSEPIQKPVDASEKDVRGTCVSPDEFNL